MNQITITKENKIIVNYETYEISPSNPTDLVIEDPWYIDVSSAPDFTKPFSCESNSLNTINIPPDTYSVSGYRVIRQYGQTTSEEKQYTATDLSYFDLLKGYLSALDLKNNLYTGQTYWNKYYTFCHPGMDILSTYYPSNYTPPRSSSILLPVTNLNSYYLVTFQDFPIIRNINVTFNSNNFKIYVPAHEFYYQLDGEETVTVQVPEGEYTAAEYHYNFLQVTSSWDRLANRNTYDYNVWATTRKLGPTLWYNYQSNTSVFNRLYGVIHQVVSSTYYVPHVVNGTANNRCIGLSKSVYTADELCNFVSNTDSNKYFVCNSTEHEILIQASKQGHTFIINPACSMTKIGEADLPPENTTDYGFSSSKRLLYHPQYKSINTSVTYNGNTNTISGRYTPAEFVREIKNVTGVSLNSDLTFPEGIVITDNPLFTVTDGVTVNNCGFKRLNYSYIAYVPIDVFDYPAHKIDFFINESQSITPECNGNFCSYSADILPDGLSIDIVTGEISGTPLTLGKTESTITVKNAISEKTYEITFGVYSETSEIYDDMYMLSTRDILIEPNIHLIGEYTITNLPSQLSYNSVTGVITGSVKYINRYVTVNYNNRIEQTFKLIAPAFNIYVQDNTIYYE